jgi:Flp pilus assembly protein TadG
MKFLVRARGFFAPCAQHRKNASGQVEMPSPAPGPFFRRFCIRGYAENEGSALLEFAFVVPMMFGLIVGMFSFGLALNQYIVLTDAVGAGARALAMARGQTSPSLAETDPCAYAVQVANADASSLATGSITYGITWTSDGTTNSYTNSCPGITLNSQDVVKMTATYPVSIFLWRSSNALNLHAHTAQLVQ